MIVDYKATSKSERCHWMPIGRLDTKDRWRSISGFSVKIITEFHQRDILSIVMETADKEAFDGKLEFDIKILPYGEMILGSKNDYRYSQVFKWQTSRVGKGL